MKNHNPTPNSKHVKKVSVYRDLVKPVCILTIRQIISIIISEKFKAAQEAIQYLFSIGQNDLANAKKKELYSFSPSCQCVLWRSFNHVDIYTSYIILDLDHLVEAELWRIWQLLCSNIYVVAAFRSPSWRGIKFIIETDAPLQDHKTAYDQVTTYYEKLLSCKIDRSGSDVCRISFIGHDPLAFYEEDHAIFTVIIPSVVAPVRKPLPTVCPLSSLGIDVTDYLFKKSVRYTNRKHQFYEGNRNNYIFLLSCYCRMNGLSREDALNEILQHYNFSQKEIQSAVRSAYRYK